MGNRSRRPSSGDGPEPVGWQRDYGDFTPEGRLEQTQKFAQSLRYMRRHGIRVMRPGSSGLVITLLVYVLGFGVVVLAAVLLRAVF